MGAPTMNRSFASSRAARLASDIIPASATTVTSGNPWGAMNARSTGRIVRVSAVLPSKACTCSGNPRASANNPTVICGSSRRSFESPGSRNPSPVSISNYRVVTSYKINVAGPRPTRAAQAAASRCRHSGEA